MLDRLGEQAASDWSHAVIDAATVPAKKGPLNGPELRRLLNTLLRAPRHGLDHAAVWSCWRL